ncbi:hypothetical protein PLESTB_000922100 [Pleodorina starrii]|uniref:PLATZ transcription factor-domain-containing protein n=1 Tax=Pleodorina starrii TaxID=330485 RepID=A0A9W6BMQ9_9CHLO|nr:hypothetical protein PLESTM_001533000 [Pleodorina starrii]GLC54934.1 hypothetical protein PLESTB_000922100 [Pleodorina starrii]GLC73619.1 hypothetical protein PLESTF_001400700 [Pleodorina starrii]
MAQQQLPDHQQHQLHDQQPHPHPHLQQKARWGGSSNGSSNRAAAAAAEPQWTVDRGRMRQLVQAAARLFVPCPQCQETHRSSRDSHVSFLDVDDPFGRAYCHFCQPVGSGARVVQVRRNTYDDVMRIGDLSKMYDTSLIQHYVINNGKVIFLRSRPQAPKAGCTNSCYFCHRALMDNNSRYCSLECKLNQEDGLPPLTPAQARSAAAAAKKVKIPRRRDAPTGSAARYDMPYDTAEQSDQEQLGGAAAATAAARRGRKEGGAASYGVSVGVGLDDEGDDEGEDGWAAAAALAPQPPLAGGDWDEDDGGVNVTVRAGLVSGPWTGGRLVPWFGGQAGPEGKLAALAEVGAAAAAAASSHRRPPRAPASRGAPPAPATTGLFAESSGRPQRNRQPPQRLASFDSGGGSFAAAAPFRDGRQQRLTVEASGNVDDDAAAAAFAARHSTRLAAAGRANSAPLEGGLHSGGGGGGQEQPSGPQLSMAVKAAKAAPEGLGDYLLSLVRSRYCKPAGGGGGNAAQMEAAAAAPLPPLAPKPQENGPVVSAFAVAAGWPGGAPTAPVQPPVQPEPRIMMMRRMSAGPGPLPAGSHAFSGAVAAPSATAHAVAAVGTKRRCASIDLGDAAAAAAAAAACNGTTLGGGGGQPEVTSPLRWRRGSAAAPSAAAAGMSVDDLAVKMSLLSPTRIARLNAFVAAVGAGGGGAAPGFAAAPSATAGGDLGRMAALLCMMPPRMGAAEPGPQGPNGAAATAAAAAAPRTVALELDADPGHDSDGGGGGGGGGGGPAGLRRVKARKGRPQQAPMG